MSNEIVQVVNNPAKIQILDKALQLFGEKGFDGATIRGIAESAGVNHALINYHFVLIGNIVFVNYIRTVSSKLLFDKKWQ